jgi:hypothetical protein
MSTAVTKAQKSLKGTVQIKSSNNRLQLVFSHDGRRHYLSLGLVDTKENRKAANTRKKLIEANIAYDHFDISKYKRSEVLSAQSLPQALPQLDEIWDGFIRFKQGQCSPSTIESMYKVFSNYVEKLPTHDLELIKLLEIMPERQSREIMSSGIDYLIDYLKDCSHQVNELFSKLSKQQKVIYRRIYEQSFGGAFEIPWIPLSILKDKYTTADSVSRSLKELFRRGLLLKRGKMKTS